MTESPSSPAADDAFDPRVAQVLEELAQALLQLRATQTRLAEAEETLRALREGEVDAIVVGENVYMLEGAEAASNRLRGDALSQMQDAVFATDVDGLLVYLNPAAERLYGRASSDVLGLFFGALFEQSSIDDSDAAAMASAIGTQTSWRGQSVHGVGPRELHVETALSMLRDHEGAVTGALAVVRDVGERARAEALLRDADRRKDEFLATLAHELRNPLAAIKGALGVMRLKGTPQAQLRMREIIDRQNQQLIHLVDDLLDVSRISRGKLELRVAVIDLKAVLGDAADACRSAVEKQGHSITMTLGTAPAWVLADDTRLTQVFSNLIGNATKYTPAGGCIGVSLTSTEGMHRVTVVDNGLGIATQDLPNVFDMFTQVGRTVSNSQGGLGIGLALVRRLVELHRGRVTLESAGPGLGTTVMVELPVAAQSATQLAPVPGDVGSVSRSRTAAAPARPTVMVAEDMRDNAETLELLLKSLGFNTVVAHDGRQALDVASSFMPDIAILDIGMPHLSGHDVARELRARRGNEILLIALSGWGQTTDRQKSLDSGFDHHLVKPVDLTTLNALLDAWQERARPERSKMAVDDPGVR